ncbi:hypothetical protein [Methanobrevibacter sp.]|uniref:hypothetical protein n=1 Tax=Methanobrevibacter sp. TaxID=66852 RepID=UPI0038906AA2
MLKKDIKVINEVIEMERSSGHIFYDLDDYEGDLVTMAEDLGLETIENEDGYTVIKNEKDRKRVEEVYNYYLENR